MPREGEAFDRYRIESVLGEGGMGVVYRAFDPRLNRRVALKVVRPPPIDDDGAGNATSGERATEATARLLREARVAASLGHPNAVAIFDVGEVDGQAFIAMELVSGRSLRDCIGDGSVPITMRLRWLHDVARVLAAAHRAGLVHRDVKPENVMIREDGDVKVLDFGIARRVSRDALTAGNETEGTLTRAGTAVGTPLYMAPEQIRGEATDARTDEFAWGVVAYELLSGKCPWRVQGTGYGTLAAIVSDEPPPLRSVAPDVPQLVIDVVSRAMSKSPKERYPSMDALVTALEPAVGASSARLLPRSAPDPMLPFLQTVDTDGSLAGGLKPLRRRRSFALPAAIGAALVVAAGLGVALKNRSGTATASGAGGPQPASTAAAAAYAMGLEARRNGMTRVATESWEHTLALDPDFAPALLRLALIDYGTGDDLRSARDLFQRASIMRAALSDPDRALLDAMSPCVQAEEISQGHCEERLQAAIQRYPSEMSLRVELGDQQAFADELDAAMATCKAALAIDPGYVYFAGLLGQLEAYAGQTTEALATLDACTSTHPAATGCIDYRLWIRTQRGECAEVAADAKNWIAAAPRDGGRWGPQHHLANAQIALGTPIEAVKETLAQGWARTPASDRPSLEAQDRAVLAILFGDFTGAEASIDALEKAVADDPTEDPHATVAALRVQLLDEEGRVAEMGDVADAFMKRRAGWAADTRIDDWEIAKDVTMRMNDALLRAEKITRVEYVARRAAWASRWGKTRIAPYDWYPAYAYWATTNADAVEALGAMPLSGLPKFHPFVYPEAAMGRMQMLAGDLEKAVPLLKQATSGCFAVEDPFTTVRSHLWLGEALEKTVPTDTPGACAAYGFVVAHWGEAKPRSVTAELARKRAMALGCGK
jgi:serine/threonine protein kinase/tetratricopeptide (TPR) repeat protein